MTFAEFKATMHHDPRVDSPAGDLSIVRLVFCDDLCIDLVVDKANQFKWALVCGSDETWYDFDDYNASIYELYSFARGENLL